MHQPIGMAVFVACLMISALGGCAALVTGEVQPVIVETHLQGAPYSGAHCTLTNGKGQWTVTTPDSVSIHRAYGNLAVNCVAEVLQGSTSISSATKGMAFGNIVLGGIIGGAVDVGTGAAYGYPAVIVVELHSPNASTDTHLAITK